MTPRPMLVSRLSSRGIQTKGKPNERHEMTRVVTRRHATHSHRLLRVLRRHLL